MLVNIIRMHNTNNEYLFKCFDSIKSQTCKDWKVYLIDDCSTDNSLSYAGLCLDTRFKVISNKERKYLVYNLYVPIMMDEIKDEDIICLIDADDWLCRDDVFENIMKLHESYDVVFTQFKFSSDGRRGWNFRPVFHGRDPGNYSHLKTFKKYLLKQARRDYFLDQQGNFYKYAADKAIMYAAVSACPFERIHFYDEICYVYNDENPLNVHKTIEDAAEQKRAADELLVKPIF